MRASVCRRLIRDERGLGAIELIVVLVLIVALAVAFWNVFGDDVACRFADAVDAFDSAGSAPSRCHSTPTAASGAGRSVRSGRASSASGSRANAASTPHGAGIPPVASQAQAASSSGGATAQAGQSASSSGASSEQAAEPSVTERVGQVLSAIGEQVLDFTEGVVAGASPLTPVVPVELKPTFGHQITYGVGQVVGSVAGLFDDAGNIIAGGTGVVASTAVLVASDGTLAPAALPGMAASGTLTAAGLAGAAGHGANFMKGLDNVVHGENAPAHPTESAPGGETPAERPPANSEPQNEPVPSGHEPSVSAKPSDLDAIYEKAPAAKAEIDALAEQVAAKHDGVVAKAPLKSKARALEKIEADYAGDASKIKDVARNTVVVPAGQEGKALASLIEAKPEITPNLVKVVEAESNPLGYSGTNVTVPTKSGLSAEIQINSPEMIYAKEPAAVSKAILGDAKYAELAGRRDLPPGGRGHELYEQWRSLPRDSPQRAAIERESRAYYDAFRRP